jgi:hypothetical protein
VNLAIVSRPISFRKAPECPDLPCFSRQFRAKPRHRAGKTVSLLPDLVVLQSLSARTDNPIFTRMQAWLTHQRHGHPPHPIAAGDPQSVENY